MILGLATISNFIRLKKSTKFVEYLKNYYICAMITSQKKYYCCL